MRTGRSGRGLFVPVIVILVGGVFLLQNRGLLPHHFAHEWWPVLLLIAGVVLLLRRLAFRRH